MGIVYGTMKRFNLIYFFNPLVGKTVLQKTGLAVQLVLYLYRTLNV